MDSEEIRIRSLYLYVACSYAAVKLKEHIFAEMEKLGITSDEARKELVLKEIGVLFLFWTTRQIWERLVENEGDAKSLNVALAKLFHDGFKLPSDERRIRYAQVSGTVEEIEQFAFTVCDTLERHDAFLLVRLAVIYKHQFKLILQYTEDAVALSVSNIKECVDEMARRDKKMPFEGGVG